MTTMTPLLLALQAAIQAAVPAPPSAPPADYPFAVGESFRYSAKLGFLRLGTGTISVPAIDTVRNRPSFVFRFALEGGNALYRLNSVLESRTTIADFMSLRFNQDSDENGRVRERNYEIYPDSGFYRLNDSPETLPTPARPLDDAAFLFFIRSFPLEVGKTYTLDYYFKTDKNPLLIRVEKREKMELPDGTRVDCLLIRPVLGDRGIFAPRQEARVWLTDDARRIPVQIRTRYPFGSVTLRLEEMQLAGTTPRSASRGNGGS